ncbi:predicted protein [Coccidioides posadasii str. Silveira]|uniref:Predicted protein n=1 Tax=Coccidioides posadasii (strain RMSCC 757 / Silveira) TaxID=443226 RepID=E9DBA5_COCPS|nr:predicted protein [Coccidioides posadasii str. Silveira]
MIRREEGKKKKKKKKKKKESKHNPIFHSNGVSGFPRSSWSCGRTSSRLKKKNSGTPDFPQIPRKYDTALECDVSNPVWGGIWRLGCDLSPPSSWHPSNDFVDPGTSWRQAAVWSSLRAGAEGPSRGARSSLGETMRGNLEGYSRGLIEVQQEDLIIWGNERECRSLADTAYMLSSYD